MRKFIDLLFIKPLVTLFLFVALILGILTFVIHWIVGIFIFLILTVSILLIYGANK